MNKPKIILGKYITGNIKAYINGSIKTPPEKLTA
jgi:hypothetical protein